MNTQPPTSVTSASLDGAMNWYGLDWARIQASVRKTQLKIAQATRKADWRKVRRAFQRPLDVNGGIVQGMHPSLCVEWGQAATW